MGNFTTNPWTTDPWRRLNELLATGQKISYHADDDGDLEEGIVHDYTILTAGQYAGTTAITINGKTCDLSNNCVKDNNTGLTWARYVCLSDIGAGANGKLFWDAWSLADKTTISFDAVSKEIRDSADGFVAAALPAGRIITVTGSTSNNNTFTVVSSAVGVIVVSEVVANEAAGASVTVATKDDLIWDMADQANANSLGGYTDWRVPNTVELYSIADLGVERPSIDHVAFPSTPTDYFWTSTTVKETDTNAYHLHFSVAGINNKTKNSPYIARLVSG